MPVRWSSTYGMLHRTVTLWEVREKGLYSSTDKYWLSIQSVDVFVSHMARDESDRAKRAKLDALQLSDKEWERVILFLSLLKVCFVHESGILCLLNLFCSDNTSMQMLHSKHFHLKAVHHYTSHCRLWRLCITHGHHEHVKTSIIALRPPWM